MAFVKLQVDPHIDLHIIKLELYADNLKNVVSKSRTLTSPFHTTDIFVGNDKLELDGNINLVKEIPDMDLSFSLQSANDKPCGRSLCRHRF